MGREPPEEPEEGGQTAASALLGLATAAAASSARLVVADSSASEASPRLPAIARHAPIAGGGTSTGASAPPPAPAPGLGAGRPAGLPAAAEWKSSNPTGGAGRYRYRPPPLGFAPSYPPPHPGGGAAPPPPPPATSDHAKLRTWAADAAAPVPVPVPVPTPAPASTPAPVAAMRFPPSFNDSDHVGPFRHPIDYAAGMAVRDRVLAPVLSELLPGKEAREEAAADGRSGSREEELESRLADLIDGFALGTGVWVERIGVGGEGRAVRARIVPVGHEDAPLLASWYRMDKCLPQTSKLWSDWWIRQCGSPDGGCEMVKLVVEGGNDGGEDVLGVAYYERSVLDRHLTTLEDERGHSSLHGDDNPVRGTDELPTRTANDARVTGGDAGDATNSSTVQEENGGKGGHKRKREEVGQSTTEGRKIRTTLLRGIRVNPRYNPEVSARGSCGSTTQNFAYRGLSGTLIAYAIVQSLRFGTEAVGANCSTKTTVAEEFYSDLLGEEKRAEQDEDGRKYFRAVGNRRWLVLREVILQQARLGLEVGKLE